MKTINVNASKAYDIIIGQNILTNVGKYIKEKIQDIQTVAIITDDIVDTLYSEIVFESLKKENYNVVKYVFSNGEKSKNAENYFNIIDFLAENHLTRSDCVLALGGGVVGDIAGFSAATYLRGVKLIQCPTTLLSMVDSSVGGKTAIDIKQGKNLLGAFYQPDFVLCDYETLKTLPENIFLDGCSEVIKYGIICDEKLFDYLSEKLVNFDREKVISRCVEIKRDVVVQDEFDNQKRQILNFGHTLGHAIEKLSSYSIPHGNAVAVGSVVISKYAFENGICEKSVYDKIQKIFNDFSLPCSTDYAMKDIFNVTKNDKKRKGDSISVVLPLKIGECIVKKMKFTEFEKFLLQ